MTVKEIKQELFKIIEALETFDDKTEVWPQSDGTYLIIHTHTNNNDITKQDIPFLNWDDDNGLQAW